MMHNTGITAETAALDVDGPQPVWMTLNGARERAFTGEIVFETDPEVFAYLDNGIVYYAERASDVSLGRRLLDAGVVDIAQLERGTVRVGDIEHLGRLFDRDPSVDRDAVVVLAETATQELIAALANESIATVRFTAYRHHRSGVHRWFVAPLDPATLARPVSGVTQLDTTVVDDLPGLAFDQGDAAELVIEWNDEIDDIPELHAGVFELSLDLAEYDDDDDAAALYSSSDVDMIDGLDVDTVDDFDLDLDLDPDVSGAGEAAGNGFEFSIVWPDGSEEPPTEATADVAVTDALVTEADAGLTESDDSIPELTVPPLELDDEPDLADADVPDDVADAVRRAIAAMESASVTAPETAAHPASSVEFGDFTEVQIVDEAAIAEVAEPAPTFQAAAGTPAGLGGFAPPTMAERAEVLYAQMEADGSMVDAVSDLDESSPSSGAPWVVFVDDPAEDGSDGGNERSSALRRLIGSLRRKDH